ncbi:MAG: DUF4184 family protein [Actinomycetes bacterium]
MPFTVSHIAAVLPAGRFPLLRDPLILSAFVVGSMSPDIPYFAPMVPWWEQGHTWAGLVLQDVPATLVVIAVYWAVLAAPLCALAPRGVRARLPRNVLQPHFATPLRTAVLLIFAAGVGAATHVLWDAFTHEGRFGVMAVPWLQLPHIVGPLPAYRVLQYVSSIVGLGLVAWSLLRWYQRTPPSAVVTPGLGWRWQTAFVTSVVTAGVLAWWSVRDLVAGADHLYGLRELIYDGLTRSIAFMALVVLVGAVMARVQMQRTDAYQRTPTRTR